MDQIRYSAGVLPSERLRDSYDIDEGVVISDFEFSVVVFPTSETLNHELSFIKAALLYSDRINLISPSVWNFLKQYEWAESLDHSALLDTSVKILENMRLDEQGAASLMMKLIKSAHFRNRVRQRLEKEDLKKQLLAGMLNVTEASHSAFISRDYPEIVKLLRSDQLTIGSFTYPMEDLDSFATEFFNQIANAIEGPSFPLFDPPTNAVLSAAADHGRIDLSLSASHRVAHASAADYILRKLPTIEEATLDELVDIKRSLQDPLIRFRGRMLEFTKTIESRPWDGDFSHDCDALYSQKIDPAIADIRTAVADNKILRSLGSKVTSDRDSILTLGSLSICVAAPGVLTGFAGVDLAAILAGGSIAISKVAQSILEQRSNQRAIERNDLYFYYQAGQTLKRLHS
ncbi:MAG: hypothetical protein ACOYEV_08050 [Candidatus Nanopelagicales bacterium]